MQLFFPQLRSASRNAWLNAELTPWSTSWRQEPPQRKWQGWSEEFQLQPRPKPPSNLLQEKQKKTDIANCSLSTANLTDQKRLQAISNSDKQGKILAHHTLHEIETEKDRWGTFQSNTFLIIWYQIAIAIAIKGTHFQQVSQLARQPLGSQWCHQQQIVLRKVLWSVTLQVHLWHWLVLLKLR